MRFQAESYSEPVRQLLSAAEQGFRLQPLVLERKVPHEVAQQLRSARLDEWFPHARAPREALAGLWLYFGGFDEPHAIVQSMNTPEACFWHAILHRREPDPDNSSYWFRRVGNHPIYPELAAVARTLADQYPQAGFRVAASWDPYEFIWFVERARARPGSPAERLAVEIQRAEWQLLFDFCARPVEP